MAVSDPYEIPADIQVKTPVFKLPDSPKKIEFFSKAGKCRLLRICEENHLDDEILFTGWVGPSDSFVREQVSDYVQHYLFRRARRLSSDRLILGKKVVAKVANRGAKKFMEYENHVNHTNEDLDQSRAFEEIKRVENLLMSGEVKIIPEGFEYIAQNEIFRANRMMDRIKKLAKSEICQNPTHLMIPNSTSIKPLKESCKEISNLEKCIEYEEKLIEQLNTRVSTPKSFISDITSVSSGFQEISPSPAQMDYETGINNSGLSNGGYFIEFSSGRSQSISTIISEISDEQLSMCAEGKYPSEVFSGDLEINLDFICESIPVSMVKEQDTCSSMYAVASKVVDMYERQNIAGKEFVEELGTKYFGK